MVNLNNLKKDRAAEKDAMDALLKKADEEKRMLSADELKEFDEHEQRFNDLTETINRAERALKIKIEEPPPAPPEPRAQPQGHPGGRITVHDNRQDEEFRSFGDQLMAIITAARTNVIDRRLIGIMERRAATGLGEAVPADGGFLVQQDFSNQILEKTYEVGVFARRATRQPISPQATGIKIPGVDETSRVDGSRYGGVRAYWVDEGATITGSKPTFYLVELGLKKLAALVYLTDELASDVVAMEAFVRRVAAGELAFKVDDAILNGDGSGKPKGILSSACLISVAKETGQLLKTITYNNICHMWSRLFAPCRPNAAWFINQDCEPQLYTMGLTLGTGGAPVYLPPGGASASPYGTLFGRPVIVTEFNQTLGTKGDIVLADLTEYYMIDKGGVQAAASIHVQFITDQQVLRFIYRCDGQPAWKAALTPFKGTNTVSPFVALAERA